jgi:hypothetical protein
VPSFDSTILFSCENSNANLEASGKESKENI